MADQKPIICIIPGAYHKPFHYRKISEPLQSQGYEVISIDFLVCQEDADPETTFFDDAAEILKKLTPRFDQGRKAVVVSHSYGALPASATVEGQTVGERAARGLPGGISAVINIAGFVFPVAGKGIMGDETLVPPPSYQHVENGITHLNEQAKPLFFGGLSAEAADLEWSHLYKTQTRKSFTAFPKYVASQFQCPKTYVLCEEDEAVPPTWQEQMACLGGYDIARLKSGHAPFLSIPEDVIDVVTRVAESPS